MGNTEMTEWPGYLPHLQRPSPKHLRPKCHTQPGLQKSRWLGSISSDTKTFKNFASFWFNFLSVPWISHFSHDTRTNLLHMICALKNTKYNQCWKALPLRSAQKCRHCPSRRWPHSDASQIDISWWGCPGNHISHSDPLCQCYSSLKLCLRSGVMC